MYYYIQQWRHHFKSGEAGNKFASGTSEKKLTPTLLEVHLHEPFNCMGAISFCVALLHMYRAFHCIPYGTL